MDMLLQRLVESVAALPDVQAVGRSGGNRPLPAPGEADIDLFVYCTAVPDQAARSAALKPFDAGARVQVFAGGNWGVGDVLDLGGVETWVMYFTLDELWGEVEAVLRGERVAREENYYYPVGRLAMLQQIAVLFDPGGLFSRVRDRIAICPDRLVAANLQYHVPRANDEEDFGRAVSRRDPLFYHFTLDLGLDHFLQALFALNRAYFPSRKRSLEQIAGFGIKPADCESRLLQVLEMGAKAGTLEESYRLWCGLTDELIGLANQNYWKQEF